MPDLSDQIARLLPAAVLCDVVEVCATSTLAPAEETADQAQAEPELPELFREFLTGSATAGAEAERVAGQFTDLLCTLDEEQPPPPPEEQLVEGLLRLAQQADRIADGDYGESHDSAEPDSELAVRDRASSATLSQTGEEA